MASREIQAWTPVKLEELHKMRPSKLIGMLLRAWSTNYALRCRIAEMQREIKKLQELHQRVADARTAFLTAAEAHVKLTRELESVTGVHPGTDYKIGHPDL